MLDALILRAKANLKKQFYIMNDSWLRECVEYYISENSGASQSAIENFVITQWLLCDLREVNNENGCLPRNFLQQEKIVLQGRYIVQVDKMFDISQSKYSQLQKIRNVSEVNVKATAIEAPAWEPKGNRMMQMFLTDGVQEFTAIEYRLIKTLKDTLLPGFKVMIIGPVACRKGVIMLKEENYREIGGEVEALLKVNALENVLARSLQLKENENPYGDENRAINDQAADAAQVPDSGIQMNAERTSGAVEFPDDEFDIDFDEITQIERLSMEEEDFSSNRQCCYRTENLRNEPSSSNGRAGIIRSGNEARREVTNDRQPSLRRNNSGESQSDNEMNSRAHLKPMIAQPSDFQFPDDDFIVDECFDAADFEDELDVQAVSASRKEESRGRQAAPKILEAVKKETKSGEPSISTTRTTNSREKTPTVSTGKRTADILSPLKCPSKVIRLRTTNDVSTGNRKITEFVKKIQPKEDPPPKICDFISDVIKEPPEKIAVFKTIRGKVTSIGNLTKMKQNWDLKATITDGTASLEVEFATQVLEDLIGFTVAEFLEKRKLRKTNPEIEEYLRKGFRTAEIKVQRMDALMDLEISSENSLPRVVSARELTNEQKKLIDKRLKMMTI